MFRGAQREAEGGAGVEPGPGEEPGAGLEHAEGEAVRDVQACGSEGSRAESSSCRVKV